MSVSVVMTTYNAGRNVTEQLNSLKNQTRVIDEVLIYDDGSSDSTTDIVKDFINNHKLSNWKFFKNASNKGWKQNFHDGVNAASSDFVFPCDQDDIWHLDKIENMEKIMLANPDINVLVGRYHIFFDNDIPRKKMKKSLWEKVALLVDKVSEKKEVPLDKSMHKDSFSAAILKIMPGCCFCVRKSFFNQIKQYWFPELGHDAFYTYFSKLTDSFAVFNDHVIEWRHHAGSTSRPRGRQKSTRLKEINGYLKVICALKSYLDKNTVKNKEQKTFILDKMESWCNLRKNFLESGNAFKGLRLFAYRKYYERNRAILTDWIYAFMK